MSPADEAHICLALAEYYHRRLQEARALPSDDEVIEVRKYWHEREEKMLTRAERLLP